MIMVIGPRYHIGLLSKLSKEFEGKVDAEGKPIQVIEDRRLPNKLKERRKQYTGRIDNNRRYFERRQQVWEFKGAIVEGDDSIK